MVKKIIVGLILIFVAGTGLVIFKMYEDISGKKVLTPISNVISKVVDKTKSVEEDVKKNLNTVFAGKEVFNVLLIGNDRRSKSATGFNTDVMILASINTKTNRVLLTSIPRDLWINDNKINALYTVFGYDTLEDAFEKITGQTVDGYIMCDFDDFKWLVDSFGGVPVTVERTFTDNTFPNDTDTGVLTVTYTEGPDVLTGWRALTFARSRKGNNGEGSDLMRAKRQHLLLKGMVEAVSQPKSQYWPMDIKKFYEAMTVAGRMKTTLTLDDATFLWDFYKDKDKYQIESFVLGADYIYHPGLYPASPYHAWVFIPREGILPTLHKDIEAKLNGTFYSSEDPKYCGVDADCAVKQVSDGSPQSCSDEYACVNKNITPKFEKFEGQCLTVAVAQPTSCKCVQNVCKSNLEAQN